MLDAINKALEYEKVREESKGERKFEERVEGECEGGSEQRKKFATEEVRLSHTNTNKHIMI